MPAREWVGRHAPGLLTAAGLIAVWEAAVRLSSLKLDSLPPPSAIVLAGIESVRSGQMWTDLTHTLTATLAGWVAACAVGIAAGVLLIQFEGLRRYSQATIELLRPLPPVAFVPVAVLAFGFSFATEFSVMLLPCLWPVLINTIGGLGQTPPRLLEVARCCRFSRWATLRKLTLPHAFPTILVGLRLSLGMALVLAVVTEMIGNPEGMGYALIREQQALRSDTMFAYLFVIGMTGVVLNAALRLTARLLAPGWRHVL